MTANQERAMGRPVMACLAVLTLGCGVREHRDERPPTAKGATPEARVEEESDDPTLRELDAAVRADPASADALWRRAGTYFERGRFDRAFRDYDAAIRLDPTNSALYDARGFARHMHTPRLEAPA